MKFKKVISQAGKVMGNNCGHGKSWEIFREKVWERCVMVIKRIVDRFVFCWYKLCS